MLALTAGRSTVIEFRVLGPVEVVEEDRPLVLGSPQQRLLLAVLLVHRGEPVSSDRLIDELWGEQAPASAIKIVQGYVSNLRKVLGDGRVGHPRTRLRCCRPSLASSTWTALSRCSRPVDALASKAIRELRPSGCGRRWRCGVVHRSRISRTSRSRNRRSRGWTKPSWRRSRSGSTLSSRSASTRSWSGELEGLVHEHPLRERLIAQLMLALYRSGRQADALESYRIARRPAGRGAWARARPRSSAARASDPVPRPGAGVAGPGYHSQAARDRSSPVAGGLLIAAGGAVLVGVLIAVAVSLAGSGSSTVRAAPNSLAAIDTRSDRVVGVAPVGARPATVAFGSGSLWVANLDDQTVSRIDPKTLRTLGDNSGRGPSHRNRGRRRTGVGGEFQRDLEFCLGQPHRPAVRRDPPDGPGRQRRRRRPGSGCGGRRHALGGAVVGLAGSYGLADGSRRRAT